MTDLPDDVLLLVMAHLDPPDVLQCRLVCKRIAPLALHADVWRHRELEDRANHSWFCPAMRLAPCVDSVDVTLPSSARELLSTAPCAARKLSIRVTGEECAALAVLIMKHQRELGRLREIVLWLHVDSVSSADASKLFVTLASIPGLDSLSIWLGIDCDIATESSPGYLQLAVAPSLKSYSCTVSPVLDRFSSFILAGHAATLEEVRLIPNASEGFLPPATTAPLLIQMPHLTELDCPIFPGMDALVACASLVVLHLTADPEHRVMCAHARAAAKLLRRAVQLHTVDLCYLGRGYIGVQLIKALASSGQSRVEVLCIDNDIPHRESFLPQLAELIRALPSLPALRQLKVNMLRDAMLSEELLAETSSINVEFGYMNC